MFKVHAPYMSDKSVLDSSDFVSVQGVTINGATYVAKNAQGNRVVPAGAVIAKVRGDYRFLPRVRVSEAISSNGTVVKGPTAGLLATGDVLKTLENSRTITYSGSYVADELIRVNLMGYEYTVTVPAGAALAAIASATVAALPAKYEAAAAGAVVTLYSASTELSTLAVAGGSGTATLGTLSAAGTVIGTVTGHDSEGNALITAADEAVGLGRVIGEDAQEILGIHATSIDFDYCDSRVLNAIHDCQRVRKDALPYWDNDLTVRLPSINVM